MANDSLNHIHIQSLSNFLILALIVLQDRQQQVKHLMPIKTYIAECLDKIQGVIRGFII